MTTKRFVLAVLAAIVLVTPFSVAGDAQTLPDDPLSAARVFETKNCVRCHQIDVRWDAYGPDLSRVPLSNNLYDIVGRMWNASPVMTSKMRDLGIEFPKTTTAELVNLIAFVGVYQSYLVNYGKEADAKIGSGLFVEKRCASCHSFSPGANTVGPSLAKYRGASSPLDILRAMWLHSENMSRAGKHTGIPWPTFERGEIRDLLAFLSTGTGTDSGTNEPRYLNPGNPKSGEQLFNNLRCSDCHAVYGVGGSTAPDLGTLLAGKQLDMYVVIEALWNHSPRMWASFARTKRTPPELSTQDLADLLAYLYFVNFQHLNNDAAHGKDLFSVRLCSSCHGAGSKSIPAINREELLAGFWNHVPKMLEACRQQGIEWPRLAPGDLSAIIDYMLSKETGN